MSNMDEVTTLLETIKDANAKIAAIQSACEHKHVRHREFRDCYMGHGTENTCADCGKFLFCSTYSNYGRTFEPVDSIVEVRP